MSVNISMKISDKKIIPVVLAGGNGTRLWPLSRAGYPKQFLPFFEDGFTMLQSTLLRLKDLNSLPPIIICNEEHRFLVAEQMRMIGQNQATILLEPVGRNTAPAIALAALHARHKFGENSLLLVLAADHFISDVNAFQKVVLSALALANENKLVAFGICPTKPETGYGYIERGNKFNEGFEIKRFVEKPDAHKAEKYIESGCFLWNSGMFMFECGNYLKELGRHAPDILCACEEAIDTADLDLTFIRISKKSFEKCPSDSIDYAVMEKTDAAVVVPMDAGWSDVGSWSALADLGKKDDDGNVLCGDVIALESSDTYVHASHRLVTTIGLKDAVVVETKDAVLVASKDHIQDVKKIVEKLKMEDRSEHINHREVYRPWGVYDSVDFGDRYQVKRITVNPGAKLSVQMHHHRAEHWIVVSGTAKIINGEESYLLTENQSTYIPVGQVHALENPGKIPLELIEVQSGAYLGEDDIVRYSDLYGRA